MERNLAEKTEEIARLAEEIARLQATRYGPMLSAAPAGHLPANPLTPAGAEVLHIHTSAHPHIRTQGGAREGGTR